MEPVTYTISPPLRAQLERAFEPLLALKKEGEPLAQWLNGMNHDRAYNLSPELTLPLRAALENTLALEGGPEGLHLLEAMQALAHGSGAPMLLIHGLPVEGPISPLLREAFRQTMHQDPAMPVGQHLRLRDRVSSHPQGFERFGTQYLHQDDADIGLLFGVTGGDNPRHTHVLPLDAYIDRVTKEAQFVRPSMTREDICALLTMPVWPLEGFHYSPENEMALQFSNERRAHAQQLGLLRRVEGREYAPLIYPNPHYDPACEGSQRYEMFKAPFSQIRDRLVLNVFDVPAEYEDTLEICASILQSIARQQVETREGPVAKEGDLLIFNNRQLLHAGGPFVTDHTVVVPKESRVPRDIATLDVFTPADKAHLTPASQVMQPIRIDHLGVRIAEQNPAR